MEKRLREVYFDKFFEKLNEDSLVELTDVQKRQIANLLSTYATDVHDDNFKKLSALNKENVLAIEKSRTQFIGMVNFIEKSTKTLLDGLKVQGLVKTDFDMTKKRTTLMGRSSVVTDMVKYLNSLNDLVIKFYKDIYQIEKVSEKDVERDKIQSSLF